VTSFSSSDEQLPVYDSLVRERGDVVAEAREVSERTQHEARQALDGVLVGRPRPVSR
jgi:hypothetical protein